MEKNNTLHVITYEAFLDFYFSEHFSTADLAGFETFSSRDCLLMAYLINSSVYDDREATAKTKSSHILRRLVNLIFGERCERQFQLSPAWATKISAEKEIIPIYLSDSFSFLVVIVKTKAPRPLSK